MTFPEQKKGDLIRIAGTHVREMEIFIAAFHKVYKHSKELKILMDSMAVVSVKLYVYFL